MGLVLKIISEHSELLGGDCEREFGEKGGTIGRSLHNDWILPDPDHYISSKHATVDFQGGAYYLADISYNGTYINGDREPLGKGNPRRLFDGDKIRMGDFEFLVVLDHGESLIMPPEEPMTVVPDHIEQLVPEVTIRTGMDLLSEEEITGDDDLHSALFGGSKKKAETEQAQPTFFGGPEKKVTAKEAERKIDKQPNPFVAADKAQGLTPADIVDAFFGGAGISRSEIDPSVDPIDLMTNAGQVLNEFIGGMSELLKCRANFKSIFRLDQTTILPRNNNPLKLSKDVRAAMKQLLVGEEGQYIGSTDSVKEVFSDLKHHHDAFFAAMNISFGEFADRFDPDELQQNFDRTIKKKPLFDILNQLNYWRLYCDLYPIMTQRGSGQFPHMFGEEFVREYEKQVAAFKRDDCGTGGSNRIREAEVSLVEPQEEEELQDQSAEAQSKPLI